MGYKFKINVNDTKRVRTRWWLWLYASQLAVLNAMKTLRSISKRKRTDNRVQITGYLTARSASWTVNLNTASGWSASIEFGAGFFNSIWHGRVVNYFLCKLCSGSNWFLLPLWHDYQQLLFCAEWAPLKVICQFWMHQKSLIKENLKLVWPIYFWLVFRTWIAGLSGLWINWVGY